MTAKTQRDDREPNADCGRGHGGGADLLPHGVSLVRLACRPALIRTYNLVLGEPGQKGESNQSRHSSRVVLATPLATACRFRDSVCEYV